AHAWVRLYSVIALEALGQLDFMFADVEPYFEAELRAVAREVGLEYVPRER
ncbi:MAG: TetR/AcrR family transcriptional regulator, partial [Actinomycetales bacterium]|nr:TetR/AcrR family transcriptional regulator [Actinomycetales bacterium]